MNVNSISRRVWIAALFAFGSLGISSAAISKDVPNRVAPIVFANFDWDNNVMHTEGKIILFKKGSGETVEITTEEFAKNDNHIGESGKWRDYEVRKNANDPSKSSFMYFTSNAKENYFLSAVKKTLADEKPDEWQAKAWGDFVHALQNEETAKYAGIITAREQTATEILEGLKYLQAGGYIRFLPRPENIACVGSSENPAKAKADVMKASLTRLEGLPVDPKTTPVLTRDGKGFAKVHLWSFSDDAPKNFKTACEALGRDVKAGKYRHVKISLRYTGHPDPSIPNSDVVIASDGSLRPMRARELREIPLAENLAGKNCVFEKLGAGAFAQPVH